MADLDKTYGRGSPSDSVIKRRARMQQALYRVHELGINACGIRAESGERSHLPEGNERANFLSDEAYAYAMQRLSDSKREPDLTIKAERLKFNMLSSQPMCFNLFSDLRAAVMKGAPSATTVIAAMFPHAPIANVSSITIEEVPMPKTDYIHDKTGWDASVRFNAGDGLITIETKYTDSIDTAAPARPNAEIIQVAERAELFTEEGLAHYRELKGFDQLGRNLLLTVIYAARHNVKTAINYVLAPAFDTQAVDLVEAMHKRLLPARRAQLQYRTIDDAIAAAMPFAEGTVRATLTKFRTRYLDLERARALVG